MHVACKCVLKQLPADSLEAQQQWPYALALAAGEAVAYAKQHLDRCAAAGAAAASGCAPSTAVLVGSGGGTQRRQTSPAQDLDTSLLCLGRFVCACACDCIACRLPDSVLRALAHKHSEAGQEVTSLRGRSSGQRSSRAARPAACGDPSAVKAARMRQALLVLMVSCHAATCSTALPLSVDPCCTLLQLAGCCVCVCVWLVTARPA